MAELTTSRVTTVLNGLQSTLERRFLPSPKAPRERAPREKAPRGRVPRGKTLRVKARDSFNIEERAKRSVVVLASGMRTGLG